MANEYVLLEDLKATLELRGESFADEDLVVGLEAASRAVDAHCGRRFWPDSDATKVRYYTPWDPRLIVVDDLITLTTLKTDEGADGTFETAWAATDYQLGPLNATADGQPFTQIHVKGSTGAFLFTTTAGYYRTVEVTGRFGWVAVPPAVKMATSILAARFVKRAREAPFGIASVGFEGGAERIGRTDPDVVGLLAPFVRRRLVS